MPLDPIAADGLKKNGKFKLGDVLNMKLKNRPARPFAKGANPFTKELVVFVKELKDSTNWLPDVFQFRL